MFVAKLDSNKSLTMTKQSTNYRQENNAEKLLLILPLQINDYVLRDCTINLNILNQDSIGGVIQIIPEEELYNGFLQCSIPITTDWTYKVGNIILWITILKSSDELILKTNEISMPVHESRDIEGSLPAQSQTILNQLIIDVSNKADGLSYSNNTLQLTNNGEPVGNSVTVVVGEGGGSIVTNSSTNGNILIDGVETNVYSHPVGTNPHGTTKNDVGLNNVPNVDTNNQTPTYTEASALTNLTSGEILTTAFGKIKKAISTLIGHITNVTNPHSVTKSQIGLSNVEDKSSATIRNEITSLNVINALGYTPINSILKGAVNGLAELDSTGKVPSSQLPSYVDDVLDGTHISSTVFNNLSGVAYTPEANKIYIDTTTNKTYRWSGTAYGEISSSLALGETASTAFSGNLGRIAYDHSQSIHARTDATLTQLSTTNGNIKINGIEATVYTHPTGTNPHGTTKSDVGLGNVVNSDTTTTANITDSLDKRFVTDAEKLKITNAVTDVSAKLETANIKQGTNVTVSVSGNDVTINAAGFVNQRTATALLLWAGTQAQKAAIGTLDANTIYVTTEAEV